MSFGADETQPYAPPDEEPAHPRSTAPPHRKHSGLGITSFVLSLISGFAAVATVVTLGVLEASSPDGVSEEAPLVIALGLGILAELGLAIIGAGLGFGGLIQPNRHRLFPVIGLAFNLVIVLGVFGLFVLGTLADG